MPDNADTKILQVLCRQTRQDRVVDLILAECRLILFEAKPPQPTSDVHGGASVRPARHDPPGETACLGCRFLNDRLSLDRGQWVLPCPHSKCGRSAALPRNDA